MRTLKFGTKIFGTANVGEILRRLDRLTDDELRITAARTLEVVHDLAGSMKAILGASGDTGKRILICWPLTRLLFNVRSLDGGLKTWSDSVQNGLGMFSLAGIIPSILYLTRFNCSRIAKNGE